MNQAKSKLRTTAKVAGVTALVAACIPCCMTLTAPILAWLGIVTIGATATGWYVFAAAMLVFGVVAILFMRRRRRSTCKALPRTEICGCNSSCKSSTVLD
jgi:hypothetical protein